MIGILSQYARYPEPLAGSTGGGSASPHVNRRRAVPPEKSGIGHQTPRTEQAPRSACELDKELLCALIEGLRIVDSPPVSASRSERAQGQGPARAPYFFGNSPRGNADPSYS